MLLRLDEDGTSTMVSVPRDIVAGDEYPTRLALTLLEGPDAPAAGVCEALGVGYRVIDPVEDTP